MKHIVATKFKAWDELEEGKLTLIHMTIQLRSMTHILAAILLLIKQSKSSVIFAVKQANGNSYEAFTSTCRAI
jgi:CMP-N-acetylneuraminic acid synthetase